MPGGEAGAARADEPHHRFGEPDRRRGVLCGDRGSVTGRRGRIERIPYELCVLGALRDALRRREIWVVGAKAWRNPDADLPVDFDLRRNMHYIAIAQPQDPTEFVASLRTRVDTALARFAEALRAGTSGAVIGTRKNQVWITVSKQPAQSPPASLDALKEEVIRRWGVVGLLDLLTEADWLTGFTPSSPPSPPASRSRPASCANDCCWCCSRWARTSASGGWCIPATMASPRRNCAAPDATSSAAPGCARRSPQWSTRPCATATNAGGHRHRLRVGLEEVRLVGVEPDDRMARPLRRPRRDDLLARRAQERLCLLPAPKVLLV